MLRQDLHDDSHLRQLIGQRSARTAVVMDYDSPSVYSSPFFSPRPNDIQFETRSVDSYRSSPRGPLEARSRLNELAESMLDLDDDSRPPSDSDDGDPDTVNEEHEPNDPRLSSVLGPKLRVHSKAPWMDGVEEDEPDSDRASSRGRDGFRKGLGLRSSSRGTTASSRPSGESSRSHQAKPKRSFETTSSANSPYGRGGALHALGQASLSSTSLVPQSAPRQLGLHLNFPLPRSESPSSSYASPSRGPASPRSVTSHRSSAASPASRGNHEYDFSHLPSNKPLARRGTNDSAASQSSYSEDMHPYANPDLVVYYADDPSPTPAPARSAFHMPNVSRSDSIATVTESLATATSLSRSATGSTLTSDPSVSSMSPSQSPRSRASMFHGKEISAPLPMHPSGSNVTNNVSSPLIAPTLPPGWVERSVSPTFALISLEEARAQRSHSSIAQGSSTSSTPFPQASLPADGHNHSPNNSIALRARARSISTGARAKSALQSIVGSAPPKPERRDSEPSSTVQLQGTSSAAGKTLKHKKSGLMRLFNGARGAGSEKEEKHSPPPVPSLSDGYAAFNAQQQGGAQPSKMSIHRVPPPQPSSSMLEEADGVDESNRLSPRSSRPIPPQLSIATGSQSRLRAASAAEDFQTRTVPSDVSDRDWYQHDLPQSAPPNVNEFPALKLRPVSTLFSSKFSDHMVILRDSDPQPALDADVDTSSSTSPTTTTPITPGMLLGRSSGDRDKPPMATISEDQPAFVQALQEQMTSAKKAWQRHVWELEGQVRDLKVELEGLRAAEGEYCDACGRGKRAVHDHKTTGVVNRPRARTGTSARFGSAV
ncbi:hypothetical protein GGX14DRAFT_421563 [Mycena pura]|uniref:Uncharacterized protein n=1 Tax=Mycena pura TaxID=153505 RepID=A0AAD6YPJ4_9AGAR|nr:hypothetical protein GGX14DRAFT_421563 [Mycena pura]